MCLSYITQKIEPPSTEITNAWKVFESVGGTLYYQYYANIHGRVILNEWQQAHEVALMTQFAGPDQPPIQHPYQSGFHCFIDEVEAKRWTEEKMPNHGRLVAVPVKIRGIHTAGMQQGYRVVVAKEMFVPGYKYDNLVKYRLVGVDIGAPEAFDVDLVIVMKPNDKIITLYAFNGIILAEERERVADQAMLSYVHDRMSEHNLISAANALNIEANLRKGH